MASRVEDVTVVFADAEPEDIAQTMANINIL
jgi:hypothetical protein